MKKDKNTPKKGRTQRVCAILCLLIAANCVLSAVFFGFNALLAIQTLLMGIAFVACAVGFFLEKLWIPKITNGLILLVFIGAGSVWYKTGQWMGLLPSTLLLLLIWQNNKLAKCIEP